MWRMCKSGKKYCTQCAAVHILYSIELEIFKMDLNSKTFPRKSQSFIHEIFLHEIQKYTVFLSESRKGILAFSIGSNEKFNSMITFATMRVKREPHKTNNRNQPINFFFDKMFSNRSILIPKC